MNRTEVALSGGAGLAAGALMAAVVVAVRYLWLAALFPQPPVAWGLCLFFGSISLLEIPVMLYGLRQLAAGKSPGARRAALFGNGAFVFFAAVYALPNLLLTNASYLWLGLLLAGSGLVRFGAGIIFLPNRQK